MQCEQLHHCTSEIAGALKAGQQVEKNADQIVIWAHCLNRQLVSCRQGHNAFRQGPPGHCASVNRVAAASHAVYSVVQSSKQRMATASHQGVGCGACTRGSVAAVTATL